MGSNESSNGKRDDDTGKFSEQYETGAFVDALRELGGSGATKGIADKVGCSRRTAHYRLSELRDEGRIDVREVGRSKLWVIEDE